MLLLIAGATLSISLSISLIYPIDLLVLCWTFKLLQYFDKRFVNYIIYIWVFKLPTYYLYSKCVTMPLQFARHILYEQLLRIEIRRSGTQGNKEIKATRGDRLVKSLYAVHGCSGTDGWTSFVCERFFRLSRGEWKGEGWTRLPVPGLLSHSRLHSLCWKMPPSREPRSNGNVQVLLPTYVSMDFGDGSIRYCCLTSSELTM